MSGETQSNAFSAWLVLVLLSLATYAVGKLGLGGGLLAALLLLSVSIKGQLVAEVFMGMGRVTTAWRWVVSGWLLAVVCLIGLAYWLGVN